MVFREPLDQSSLSDALSKAGSDNEFFRYAALVGFIDRLMNARRPQEIEELERLARRLGPANDVDAPEPASARRDREPTVADLQVLLDGYEHATGGRKEMKPPASEPSRPASAEPKGIFLVNLNRVATKAFFKSRKTVKADAARRVFDLRTEGIAFAVIDGGINATHPAFLNWSTTKADEYIADKSRIPLVELQARSRIAATYDLTLVRDIIASNGDPKMASPKVRPTIEKLAANKAQKTAFEHMAVRNANARDLDWEIVLPLMRIPHDAGYAPPEPTTAPTLPASWPPNGDNPPISTFLSSACAPACRYMTFASSMRTARATNWASSAPLNWSAGSTATAPIRWYTGSTCRSRSPTTSTASPADKRRSARPAIIWSAPAPWWSPPPAIPASTALSASRASAPATVP